MAYKSSPRTSRPVSLIAVHTAEGARTAASLGAYFYRPEIQASSHVGIDAGATLQYVPYDRSAWTLRTGNPISDNAEICAFAAFTRNEWLGTATVQGCPNPRAMLDRTAAWIRSRCLARGIPIRKLSSVQVRAGMSGVIGHVDWTNGMSDGTHTDPGGHFPWDYVMARASETPGGGASPAPIPDEQTGVELMERIMVTPPTDGSHTVRVYLSGTPAAAVIVRPKLKGDGTSTPMWIGHIYAWGSDKAGVGGDPANVAGYNSKLTSHRRYALPGAVWADINYSALPAEPFEIDCF